MSKAYENSEPLCETGEKGEKLFVKTEIEEIGSEVGRRIVEAFDYLPDSEIAFLLKTSRQAVKSFTAGGELPPAEILLGIHKITGASIDWILTGQTSRAAEALKLRPISKKLRLVAA